MTKIKMVNILQRLILTWENHKDYNKKRTKNKFLSILRTKTKKIIGTKIKNVHINVIQIIKTEISINQNIMIYFHKLDKSDIIHESSNTYNVQNYL